jgi:hypothetical protein
LVKSFAFAVRAHSPNPPPTKLAERRTVLTWNRKTKI